MSILPQRAVQDSIVFTLSPHVNKTVSKTSMFEEAKENINPHPTLSKLTTSLSPVKGVLVDITHQINSLSRMTEDNEAAEELIEDHESNFLQDDWTPNYSEINEDEANEDDNADGQSNLRYSEEDMARLTKAAVEKALAEYKATLPAQQPINPRLKYTDEDLEQVRNEVIDHVAKETESLAMELVEYQRKYEESERERLRLQNDLDSLIRESEDTIQHLVQEQNARVAIVERKLNEAEIEAQKKAQETKEMESSFAALHKRYEQLKQVGENFQKNEQTLKGALSKSQKDLITIETQYKSLKAHAEEKLKIANSEIQKLHQKYQKEAAVLTAKLYKNESLLDCINEQLKAKVAENEELVTVFDQYFSASGLGAPSPCK